LLHRGDQLPAKHNEQLFFVFDLIIVARECSSRGIAPTNLLRDYFVKSGVNHERLHGETNYERRAGNKSSLDIIEKEEPIFLSQKSQIMVCLSFEAAEKSIVQ
jgi:hypothetical protein